MKQIIKKFNNLVKKTIFKVQNKTNNNFNISSINIIRSFNNSVKTAIFKVQNKTNNNFNISNINKFLITFIASLFLYLFYLLIPLLYDKTWVQANIESKLFNEFKVNLSTSADISYRILPSPHFLIKDSKILLDNDEKMQSVAEIQDFKLFLNQRNFFDKEKVGIRKIIINGANFSLLKGNLKSLNKFANKKFSNKKVEINNSNIFFKDNLGDIILIIKINKTVLFFDNKNLSNFINLKGEIFNLPFTLAYNNRFDSSQYKKINFKSKSLKLNIFNTSTVEKEITSGKNNILFSKSSINTKYNIKEKFINFESEKTKLGGSQVAYNGELSINPFDLDLRVYLNDYKMSKLFNINPILIEFVKSGLLFNDNISLKTSINFNSKNKNESFHNAKIIFHVVNGKINFDKTKFANNEIGTLQIDNSNLFYKSNKLVLNSDILINIKSSDNLFSFLNTNKSSRKDFKTILINLNYNFSSNKIEFNNLKIDDKDVDNELLTIIDGLNVNDLNNLNKSRRLFNKFLKAYSG